MNYVKDVLLIVSAFLLFGYLHSLLASIKIKNLAVRYFGNLIAFYRLIYNFISFLLVYLFLVYIPKPSLMIYDLPNPWDLLTLIPQAIGIAGVIWSARYFSLSEFAGISQIKRWMDGNYQSEDLDEKLTFRAEGPYKFSRHPLYFFIIVFMMFRPYMDLFDLTLFLCAAAYFYIGSVYEEKKLSQLLGEPYIKYQKEVPRIIPIKIRFR